MNLFPFQFHNVLDKKLITNDAGEFFLTSEKNLKNMIDRNIDQNFSDFLFDKGFQYKEENDLYWNNFKFKLIKRKKIPDKIGYYMIIPTLRCNLNCTYCQVSRADENAKNYDWEEEHLNLFYQLIESNNHKHIKIEFQGGEPTLRSDIIKKILDWTSANNIKAELVICTNLQNLNSDLLEIIDHDNVFISTSIDGKKTLHERQRTENKGTTDVFFNNLHYVLNKYGIDKVSALPTFTDFSKIEETIDFYIELGLKSIFLRPVNYQGFARKKFPSSQNQVSEWSKAYFSSLEKLFIKNHKNKQDQRILEFGFENSLKRIFNIGYNGYVDLRSPNFYAKDNIIIDFDGKFYPSDEARMLSRIKIIDFSIGNLKDGLDSKKITDLNWNSIGETNPDCINCAYQPYCGVDMVDDISRYNRIDIPKHLTAFCQSQMSKFNFIFEKITSMDPVDIFNINGHLTKNFNYQPPFGKIFYDTTH